MTKKALVGLEYFVNIFFMVSVLTWASDSTFWKIAMIDLTSTVTLIAARLKYRWQSE